MSSIQKRPYGTTQAGEPVEAYTLVNEGLTAEIITFGGILTRLLVPDRNGMPADVMLAFDSLAPFEKPGPYFGALIGRVGNRTAKGRFTLHGKTHILATNNGANHLHGGLKGYDKRVWKAAAATSPDGPTLTLTLTDKDGTEGYPGTVEVTVVYTLRAGALRLDYSATTDKATPINLTHHAYFNLKDGGASDVLGHVLQIDADGYTPVDEGLIPTGQIAPVKGTPIDFTAPKPIGKDLKAMGGDPAGYDHNLVLRHQNGSLARAAVVTEPTTGRKLEVWTTEPGMQFYSGNFLDGAKGKGGIAYHRHHGFCLETQHYPDAINRPEWPSIVLQPGQKYHSVTEFRFGIA
ncbi:MAG TPA: aldose epimerase family protein [Phycisphaerae bacterium]|nr:aldose epimerase family protein [Phycisphaerae bacterium]